MFYYLAGYYLAMKAFFLFSLVRIQIKFETMKDHWLFLGILYTTGVAFLSFIYLMSWQDFPWGTWRRTVHRANRNFALPGVRRRDAGDLHLVFLADGQVRRGCDFWTLLLMILLVYF